MRWDPRGSGRRSFKRLSATPVFHHRPGRQVDTSFGKAERQRDLSPEVRRIPQLGGECPACQRFERLSPMDPPVRLHRVLWQSPESPFPAIACSVEIARGKGMRLYWRNVET